MRWWCSLKDVSPASSAALVLELVALPEVEASSHESYAEHDANDQDLGMIAWSISKLDPCFCGTNGHGIWVNLAVFILLWKA